MTNHSLPTAAALGRRAFAMLEALNRFTDEPGKLTRLYLSPAHKQAVDHVLDRMREIGLAAHVDALGSVHGRMEGRKPGLPAIMIGSHIDTVKDAGAYDGNLGVVAGLLVAETLRGQAASLPFALEVAAFGDEENVRFPTNLSTSAALSSGYELDWLEARDTDGISVREALVAFGGDPDGVAALKRAPGSLAGYIELHIEQGPVLEVNNEPVGIVTAINAQTRARVRVSGEAGHAGTVPMALRKDALAATAEMVLAMEAIARSHPDAVGTVGVLKPEPGATNVVPGAVSFTIDFRAPLDATVASMHDAVQSQFAAIAARRGVDLSIEPYSRLAATPMAASLQTALERGIARTGANLKARRIPSGAGHDAMTMARAFPAAMLFVRNEKGISHSPLENMTEEDAGIAIKVMLETVLALAAES
ncbi:MAG: allantoate amidohydrolase [Bosea sp. (in: a-proteobacteria)]